ncbi:GtrA family protein [Clostridium sp. CX1]|uniref:GtrA family protein n=1 Tax=Clostridium tanneri TaxID=3037988 RepID=A0ABU4JXI4_9CLOT|nr:MULTISPECIES: GtrA family protein [unclassified Clostridium]MCT8978622.1 GtrA family protein [Clostridium sp. CX1]MDW8802867.1 GtrA family protein [Clostridium sp. A1-XYC3]
MKLGVNLTGYLFLEKARQLSRFSLVGALNTLIDFVVFTIFQSLFGVNYVVSQIAGYSFGIANSFIFNKNWTFKNKNRYKKITYEFLQFIGVNLFSLTITLIAIRILVGNFQFNVYTSKVIVTLIAQLTNFLGYKLWVFK